jgi:hypothetical protein
MVRSIIAVTAAFGFGYFMGFIVGNIAYEAVSTFEKWHSSSGIGQHLELDVDY